MDNVSPLKRSEIMRKIRNKDSMIEMSLRRILFNKGFRFRKNVKYLFGKPDIAFIAKKTVIFIDSCFWHGCSKHCRLPKSNRAYWINKIKRNRQRDIIVNRFYKKNEWKIFRVWEHKLNNTDKVAENIIKYIT